MQEIRYRFAIGDRFPVVEIIEGRKNRFSVGSVGILVNSVFDAAYIGKERLSAKITGKGTWTLPTGCFRKCGYGVKIKKWKDD